MTTINEALNDLEIQRHLGNPRLIRIKGLRVVEMPECEGGGYALTGDIAEQMVAFLQAALTRSAWQPIETAPRDGTHILLHTEVFSKVRIGWFYNGGWHWDGDYQSVVLKPPTKWMPLPAPPVAGEGGVT